MKATMNLRRPPKPIEIRPKYIIYFIGIIAGLLINVAMASWVTAASKADYDNRIKYLEKVTDGIPNKLSTMEGKIDTVQGKIDTVILMMRK